MIGKLWNLFLDLTCGKVEDFHYESRTTRTPAEDELGSALRKLYDARPLFSCKNHTPDDCPVCFARQVLIKHGFR